MTAAILMRTDYNQEDLLQLARKSKDGGKARRLLALAAIAGGMGRTEAAHVGGMDRQTLCDWVHRFNDERPDGLKNRKPLVLPPYSPELNPVENIWQYLRQNWLSNRVFKDYEHLLDASCKAWNKLCNMPGKIRQITERSWTTRVSV